MNAIEGIKPATIVEDEPLTRVFQGPTNIEALESELKETRDKYAETLQHHHDIWYNASFTWSYTHFLGNGMMKCPNDLWVYQDIMTRLRPRAIIETGTYSGGSALWFAFLMDMLRIDGGKVFTVDIKDYRENPSVLHPRITFLAGSSIDPELVDAIKQDMPDGPVLVCLDSDHSAEHVRKELELYAPLCKIGDWLVVEDTNIGWTDGKEHTVTFKGDLGKCTCGMQFMNMLDDKKDTVHLYVHEQATAGLPKVKCPHDKNDMGARGGLIEYMDKHPNEWKQDILSERYLLTMNPGGWLQRVGEYRG